MNHVPRKEDFMNRVINKVIIVTGGSTGIGQAACFLLAREGASIALVDINDKAGMDTIETIQSQGGKAEFWHMDVTKEEAHGMSNEELQIAYDKLQPIGHIGEVDDIAYGILYLASDESKFMTASELVIDGGISGGRLFN